MEKLLPDECSARSVSTAALAFVGDAVFGLLARERLCCTHSLPASKLHSSVVSVVRCEAQAKAVEQLMPILTEAEKAVFMRGRNAHSSHVPKKSAIADYRMATGLEALFGYIYLDGNIERLRELFDIVWQSSCRD
ncbi:MAG: ribonuclease III [Clostridia bacterium]|nr:ribonuclease III [Oscillospiraceae bacterium]MBQ6797326.1 ribonuclease III [Clostridia bacterium]